MSERFVTVFTITYNQRHRVLALMYDLAEQTYPATQFELVILDDGSTDGTADAIDQASRDLTYNVVVLRRDHEADYLSAQRWNECIAAASSRSSVLVQLDDVRVRHHLIERHVAWHADDQLRLVTGSKFEGDEVTWALQSCRRAHLAGEGGTPATDVPWTAIWGASLSYPRALVDQLWVEPHERPYDERMTGWGHHEAEMACRAHQAGAQLVYDPGVGVFHQNHTSTSDAGRGIDHQRAKTSGAAKNEQYVRLKQNLTEIPRW